MAKKNAAHVGTTRGRRHKIRPLHSHLCNYRESLNLDPGPQAVEKPVETEPKYLKQPLQYGPEPFQYLEPESKVPSHESKSSRGWRIQGFGVLG